MGDQPDRPRDRDEVGALDDMLSQGHDRRVEQHEWYASQGFAPPPDNGIYRAGDGVAAHQNGAADEATIALGRGQPGFERTAALPRPEHPPQSWGAPNGATSPPGQPGAQGPGAGSGYGAHSVDDQGRYAAPPRQGGQLPPPAHQAPRREPPAYYAGPRHGPSGAVLFAAAAVGGIVVLAAVVLLWMSGNDSSTNIPSAGGSTSVEGSQDPSASEGSSDQPTDGATEGIERGSPPEGSEVCDTGGADIALAAASGNNRTSCPFSRAVRDAYVKSGVTDGHKVDIRATSPVTDKTYTMKCEGAPVITCRGADDAVVYLY